MEIEDFERFPDEADNASRLELKQQEAALADVIHNLKPQSHPDFDGVNCVEADCGEPLHKVRLDMGRIRCTECQERFDRLIKRR